VGVAFKVQMMEFSHGSPLDASGKKANTVAMMLMQFGLPQEMQERPLSPYDGNYSDSTGYPLSPLSRLQVPEEQVRQMMKEKDNAMKEMKAEAEKQRVALKYLLHERDEVVKSEESARTAAWQMQWQLQEVKARQQREQEELQKLKRQHRSEAKSKEQPVSKEANQRGQIALDIPCPADDQPHRDDNGGIVPDKPTTMMLCNIPGSVTRKALVRMFDSLGFGSTYDTLHVPMNQRGYDRGNIGYAFINFVTPEDANCFKQVFEGFQFPESGSEKSCTVKPAHLQGNFGKEGNGCRLNSK